MAAEIRLADRLNQLDKEIKGWSRVTRKQLIFRVSSLTLEERVKLEGAVRLKESIKDKLRKKQGDIESVAFSFIQHGIFFEHGVGKGRPVRSAKANKYKKPWLSAILPNSIEELANILESEYADIAAAELKLNIPGIKITIK